jgi:hypothetical protein
LLSCWLFVIDKGAQRQEVESPSSAQLKVNQEIKRESRFVTKAQNPDALLDAKKACFSESCELERQPEAEVDVRLLVGIVSEHPEDAVYRSIARKTWANKANALPGVKIVFFVPAPGQGIEEEQEQYGDIVLEDSNSDNMPIGYQMLHKLSQLPGVQNILSVGVRSVVNVQRLLAELDAACVNPSCRDQRIWAGQLVTNRKIGDEGERYKAETGLSSYLPYMRNGSYVLSQSLATALVLMHTRIGLKPLADEDVSLGLWLVPVPVQRIDLSQSFYTEPGCCLDSRMKPKVDVCARSESGHQPVLLANLDSPDSVIAYHEAFQRCKGES